MCNHAKTSVSGSPPPSIDVHLTHMILQRSNMVLALLLWALAALASLPTGAAEYLTTLSSTGEFTLTYLTQMSDIHTTVSGAQWCDVSCVGDGRITLNTECGDGQSHATTGYLTFGSCTVPGNIRSRAVALGDTETAEALSPNTTVQCFVSTSAPPSSLGPAAHPSLRRVSGSRPSAPGPEIISMVPTLSRVGFSQDYIVSSAKNLSLTASGAFTVPTGSVLNLFSSGSAGRCEPGTTAFYSIDSVLLDGVQASCSKIDGFTCSALTCQVPASFSDLEVNMLFVPNGDYSGNAVTAGLSGSVVAG